MDPDHDRALQQAANVLSNWLGRDAEAVVALDRLVAARPQSAVALVNRAVLLGRAGDRAGAVRDAEAALLADPSPPIIYRTAGAFAQAGDNARAIAQLTSALRANVGTDLVDRDPDLDPLRDDPAFRRLVTRRTD